MIIKRFTDNMIVRSIRYGLVKIIPVLMIGSFALIIKSFPLSAYQDFIQHFAGGFILTAFNLIYNATFGMLSVYMVVSLANSVVNESKYVCKQELGAPISALIAFLILVGFLTDSFEDGSLGPSGMFVAIICATTAPVFYVWFSQKFEVIKLYSDGADIRFNYSIVAIPAIALTSLIYAIINTSIFLLTDSGNFWALTSNAFSKMFESFGSSMFGAFMYVFLSSILWFFGIHGSDVLESVNIGIFKPAVEENAAAVVNGVAPEHIFTKTFFDVFVLIGGCGTLLALLIALFIFSKRKNNRAVAKIAVIPMIFNINEIMVFGLPIIYNPIMLIPFVLTPIVAFFISAGAMYFGLVPLTRVCVEWTTPIILGGYQATGSVAGAVLQVVNIAVGVLIYMPFVKMYDKEKELEATKNIDSLVDTLKKDENNLETTILTELTGVSGEIAKQLVNDLRNAISHDELYMNYQPQFNNEGKLVGAEALLRWNHPSFGIVYPPLIIAIANESGMLETLERYVLVKAGQDMEKISMTKTISINVTPTVISKKSFIDFLKATYPEAKAGQAKICIEITEQSELIADRTMVESLKQLRELGFLLAIDDFSMGYTSLKYLSDNHFDVIKLDGTLVKGLDNPRNKDIIASIVYLSHSLGFKVLAEYVETVEQRDQLAQIGCLEYQGYLYSKALPIDEFKEFACASNAFKN